MSARAVSPDARGRLRPQNRPRSVTVGTDPAGIPVAVTLGRRRRRVDRVQETWRIDDEWWRRPISRLYHDIVLEDGTSLVLYRDLLDGGWFVQA